MTQDNLSGNGRHSVPQRISGTLAQTIPAADVYLTRPELRRSCTSPECGRDAQQAHVLAKRGYIQMCDSWPREV